MPGVFVRLEKSRSSWFASDFKLKNGAGREGLFAGKPAPAIRPLPAKVQGSQAEQTPDSTKAPSGAFGGTAALRGYQAISAVVSKSKVSSPSLMSMCTTPPWSDNSPNRISSANGRLILSWIKRAIGRAPMVTS